MSVTIQKSTLGNSFTVLNTGETQAKRYQCGDFYFEPNTTDGSFSLVNKFNQFQVVSRQLPSSVINGDTGVAFANLAAVDLYCATNFFYKATAGGGSSLTYTQDASAVALTKTQLNATYGAYKNGDIVFVATAGVKYLKTDNINPGNWDTQPYNLTT